MFQFSSFVSSSGLENQLISSNRKEIIQRYSTEEAEETVLDYPGTMTLSGQTVLTPAAKKQGVETVLPSIIHCVKGDGGRVEVEPIPRITEVAAPDQPQTLEIANVQDPETGVTRCAVLCGLVEDCKYNHFALQAIYCDNSNERHDE